MLDPFAAGIPHVVVPDAPEIPERELFTGKPSGSACPLVWAHAEYIKLRRSLRDGTIFDQPPQTVQRYVFEKRRCTIFTWRFNNKPRSIPCGKTLRLDLLSPAMVHWSFDGWQTAQDSNTWDTGLGVHVVDLPTEKLTVGRQIVFTFYWIKENRWHGADFSVTVE